NNLIGILNFLTFLLSIPILGAGIWLSTRASTDCEKFLERPVIALGVFLMIVSIAGLVGACCGVSWLLWLYLLVMFILILLVFCFTIFAFVVTNKGAGEVVSGRGYKEYRLGDYSNWLQKRVLDEGNWSKIRSCIRDSKVCNSLSEKNQTFDQFVNDNLTPLQVCNSSYCSYLLLLTNFKFLV
ncbi:tetraspanin-8-like, partial [Phalaenopsis equestris]|uniref:tetraspanin-8-like n=1 Tax=Phalaenopsis equestris TaxID=78828 RepID=UPI0009E461FE